MSIHSTFRVSTAFGLPAAMVILGTGNLHGAAGDLETGFAPTFLPATSAIINTMVPQADGKYLIGGGGFTSVNGNTSFRNAARLNSDGTLDTSYMPAPDGPVYSINHQLDGSMFLTGAFSYVNTLPNIANRVSRPGLAKFTSAAGVDSTFVPTNSFIVWGIREHIQSKWLVASEGGLRRLAPDFIDPTKYIEDQGFTSYPVAAVWHADVQTDSRILLSGSFNNPLSVDVDRPFMDRVKSDGREDLEYVNPLFNNQVHQAIFQPDQKILACGQFSGASVTIAGTTTSRAQQGIMRFNAIGNFDEAFSPIINGNVTCMALQADGKILIGGDFTQVKSITDGNATTLDRRGIARLNGDGTVDSSFDAKINLSGWTISSITILADGKLLITGAFQAFNNVLRSKVARLSNDPATSDLRALNSKTVRWDPGGASPLASAVVFEYSVNGTSGWTKIPSFTNPTTSNGGWEVASYLDLPNPCFLRVRAQIPGGLHGSSYGTMITPTAKYPVPRVALLRNPSTNVTRDSTVQLGYVGTGTTWDFPFTVRNIGTSNLTISSVEISGTNASRFSIVQAPASTLAGPSGTSPLIIRFSPDSNAEKNATITINTNTPEWPSFVVKLKGSGIATEIEGWRHQYFGITTNTGNALSTADPDGDGQTNAFEFVTGSNPTSRTSRFTQSATGAGGQSKLTYGPWLAGRTYQVESSTNLQTGSWVTATGSNVDAGTQRTFTDSAAFNPTRFYRVRITKP